MLGELRWVKKYSTVVGPNTETMFYKFENDKNKHRITNLNVVQKKKKKIAEDININYQYERLLKHPL